MKFVNVRLLVGDIRAAIRFWRDVMGFRMSFGDEAMGYAYFETDSAGVELMTGPQNRPAWQVRSAHLSDPDGYLVEIYSQLAGAEAHQA